MDKIVAIERTQEGQIDVFLSGVSNPIRQTIPFFLLADKPFPGWKQLDGDLPLKYYKEFPSSRNLWDTKKIAPPDTQWLHIYDDRDSALINGGLTYFQGLTNHKDLSILSFDIESTGLNHGPESKVLIISNTYRPAGGVQKSIRKLFAYDDYKSTAEFFLDWTKWVREMDPDVIVGHNIYSYDLPYMDYCARRSGVELKLGRDGSALKFNSWESRFRRDQSQFYTYNEARIYGRNLIDTFFLSIKSDIGRQYESYGLKQIIKQENLEVKDREFYDANEIRTNYQNPIEWAKIKRYAEHDADDALALYDLMIPAYFHMAQIVPQSFSNIINRATGSQINQMIIQDYLKVRHSIPIASPAEEYQGADSGATPGIYGKSFKADVASLYPSLMLTYHIEDKEKDPRGSILRILTQLRLERLRNKKQAAQTGQRLYKDLSEARKVLINSMYGFLGTPGLNFNAPDCAAEVTRYGREVLSIAKKWADENQYILVNWDTDSITISLKNDSNINPEFIILGLNKLMPDGISWENDGIFESVVVLKIKNYGLLYTNGKIKLKGSGIKASLKEPALREMISRIMISMLNNRDGREVADIYHGYVTEILSPAIDMKRWAFKRTITDNLKSSTRTNETKVMDALEGEDRLQEGDKYYLYFRPDGTLSTVNNWKGDHDVVKLLQKLYKTIEIFEPVYPIEFLPNYSLKKNLAILETWR